MRISDWSSDVCSSDLETMAGIEPNSSPVTRRGDVFELGKHRILCGDAMDPTSFFQLMGTQTARLALSDPPYNCKIDGFVDRKSVVSGKSVLVRVDMGGRRIIKKKK